MKLVHLVVGSVMFVSILYVGGVSNLSAILTLFSDPESELAAEDEGIGTIDPVQDIELKTLAHSTRMVGSYFREKGGTGVTGGF